MAKRKTEFELVNVRWDKGHPARKVGTINIVCGIPENHPYVSLSVGEESAWMEDEDIETFALNILKALKSKHLKQ